MTWFLVVVSVLVIGAAVVIAAGGGITTRDVHEDRRDLALPTDRAIDAGDLRDLRFTMAFRGYRTDEVDALVARLRSQLEAGREGADGHDDPSSPYGP